MKFKVYEEPKGITSKINDISESRKLNYLIYPSQQEEWISVGIIRTGHTGGIFFKGKIIKEEEQKFLVGEFVNTNTLNIDLIKKSKGDFFLYVILYSLIIIILSVPLFLAWVPLYFIIGKPWWISALIIISIFLNALLHYVAKEKFRNKKIRINSIKKLKFLKDQFIDIIVIDLKFQMIDDHYQ